jgi:hypothetical protein
MKRYQCVCSRQDRIRASVRICRMSRYASAGEEELNPATLTYLDFQVGGLTDHDRVRVHAIQNGPECDTFDCFLQHRCRNRYSAAESTSSRSSTYAHDCCRKATLHVRATTSVKARADLLSSEGVNRPFPDDRHHIHMAVEKH